MELICGKCSCRDCGLLILRLLPAYFLVFNHGWGKITSPEKWDWLGSTITKYFFGFIDFANPFFGFLAAFSESICAVLVLIGLFTRYAALLTSITMFVAAMHHLTTTGSPESALVYFSVFMAVVCLGPGKYSIDNILFNQDN
jgi:putative oxidoreductase